MKHLTKFLIAGLFLFLFVFLAVYPEPVEGFFSGATFEDRKAAYINDQGRKWGAGDLMKGVWAWLEGERRGLPDPMLGGKTRKQLISDAIVYITGPGWWTGASPGPNPTARMYYQYYQDPATRVISAADGAKLEQALSGVGDQILND